MENPRKHDKKKNLKTLPVAINIGAGRFGVGGILLVGGALVTATIVSAFAFKARSQRRSSSENMKKGMSPSPETLSVDVQNKLELLMKTNKDCCVGSLPLEVQKQNPSDEVTTKKEIQTNSIQSLTQDENHEYLPPGDSNEDIIVSSVGEDQENTSVHDDSAFESEELDNSCEKIDMDCEEQVTVAAQIEEDSSLKRDEELLGNENDERVDADSSVSDDKGVALIEEYHAVEAPVKEDIVSEASVNENEEGEDHQETVSMNKVTTALTMEAACVNMVEVEDNLQVQLLEEIKKDCQDEIILENCEGHLSDETGYADQSVHEVVMEEEVIKAACVNLVNTEDISKMSDHEVASPDAEEMHKVCETFVVECVMNGLKEAVDDQTTAKQDAPPSQSMNKEEKDKETTQNVEEQMTIEDELLIEAAKVDDQTHNPPSELMNKDEKEEETDVQDEVEMVTEQELVNKDEIPHVQSVKEDEDGEEEVKVKEDTPASELMTKDKKDEEASQKVEEHVTIEDESFNEDEKDNVVEMPQDQTAEEKEDELVKKDEVPQVKSIKGDENTEELSPEAKISNHKTEENKEEKQTTLGEKQAFASESWNLKLMIWSVLISVWCLCHWYSEQPFLELSLVGSLLFILILLGYRNRTTYLVKYE